MSLSREGRTRLVAMRDARLVCGMTRLTSVGQLVCVVGAGADSLRWAALVDAANVLLDVLQAGVERGAESRLRSGGRLNTGSQRVRTG